MRYIRSVKEIVAEAYDVLLSLANRKARDNNTSEFFGPVMPAFWAPTSNPAASSNVKSATIIALAENALAAGFIAVPYAFQFFAYRALINKFGFSDALIFLGLVASTVILVSSAVLIIIRVTEKA